jgi:hypothetical protein
MGGRHAASVIAILGSAAFAACGGGGSGSTGTAGAGGSAGASAAGANGSAGASTAGASGSAGAGGAAGANGSAGASATAGASGSAGASATAGTSGSAGADGGTSDASALTLPVERSGADGGSVYALEFGDTKFVVDPAPGGRIVEYSLDGTNILTNATVNPSYWGSTLWTAPEGEWMTAAVATAGSTGMMIVPGFDTLPYPMTVAANNSFSGSGPNVTFANMTFDLTKQFTANLAAGAIDIVYSITNKGTGSMTLGHWEVTRVFPDGLTFFPAPDAAAKAPTIANPAVVNPCVTITNGTVWLDHSKYVPGTQLLYGKYSTDASGGWIAHVVTDTTGKGDILLVKTFAHIPDGTAGAGHAGVEVYYRPDRSYEEIEDHYEQATFTPQQKIDWPVRWYLRRLPTTITRTVGNQQLVDYVTNLIK